MSQLKNIVKVSALVSAIILIGGCGSKTLVDKQVEKGIEDATGQKAQVDINNNSVNIQEANGGSVQAGVGTKVPDDFPKDIYVIEGEVKVALKNMYGNGYNLSILTDKSIPDAKKLYEDQLKAAGWKMNMDAIVGEIVMMSGEKDGRTVSVSVNTDPDTQKTSVVITDSEPTK
jgi:hypothetical protein